MEPEAAARVVGDGLLREGALVRVHPHQGPSLRGEVYALTSIGVTLLTEDGANYFYPWVSVRCLDLAPEKPRRSSILRRVSRVVLRELREIVAEE